MQIQPYLAARSGNKKTDNVPTVWIGTDKAQARASCDAVNCKLRPWLYKSKAERKGKAICYAHAGTPALGLSSITRSRERGTLNLDMNEAIKRRAKSAKFIRIGALGDPGVLPWGYFYTINRLAKKHGLKTISYTHGWRQRPDLVGWTLASVESIEEAMEARKMGFSSAIVLRMDPTIKGVTLPDGKWAPTCPAIRKKALGQGAVKCNDCMLCAKKTWDVIFPDHGPTSETRRKSPFQIVGAQ